MMPRSRAAAMSIEALAMPVVTSSGRFGRRASRLRVNGVRSRIATTTSKRREPRGEPGVSQVVVEDLDLRSGASVAHGPRSRATPW